LKIVVSHNSRENAYAAKARIAFGNCYRHKATMAGAAIDHCHHTYSDARGPQIPKPGLTGRSAMPRYDSARRLCRPVLSPPGWWTDLLVIE